MSALFCREAEALQKEHKHTPHFQRLLAEISLILDNNARKRPRPVDVQEYALFFIHPDEFRLIYEIILQLPMPRRQRR